MQQQQTTKSPVHVKVALDNEFRRFLLTPITFAHLEATLKTLFSLKTDFRVKFQDDEKDWVLITTDEELVYAAELSGSPLRLQVNLLTSDLPPVASVDTATVPTGRWGRGRGRGACRAMSQLPRDEKLRLKATRIGERINQLESKLNSPKITGERQRVICWKISKLQEQLDLLKALIESLPADTNPVETQGTEVDPSQVPDTGVTENPEPAECPRRGGRCGRGGWRRAMEEGSDQPRCKGKGRIAPEIIANFQQCKANLQAARESQNAEEIAKCREAFQAAKAARIEARMALRAQAACVDEQKA